MKVITEMGWDALPSQLKQSIIANHIAAMQSGAPEVHRKKPKAKPARTTKRKTKETGNTDNRDVTPSLSDDDAMSYQPPAPDGDDEDKGSGSESDSALDSNLDSNEMTLTLDGKRKQGDRQQGSQKRPKTQRMPAESTQRDDSKKFEKLPPEKRGM